VKELVKNRQTQRPKESQCGPSLDGGARQVNGFIGGVKLTVIAHDFGQGVNVNSGTHGSPVLVDSKKRGGAGCAHPGRDQASRLDPLALLT